MTEPPVSPDDTGTAVPSPASSLEHGAAEVTRLVLLLDPYGTGDWAAGAAALMDSVAALPPEEAYSLLACSVLMLALETPVPRLPARDNSDDEDHIRTVREVLAHEEGRQTGDLSVHGPEPLSARACPWCNHGPHLPDRCTQGWSSVGCECPGKEAQAGHRPAATAADAPEGRPRGER